MGELKNCIKWLWCLLAHRKHHVLHSQVEYGGGSVWVCARCGQALLCCNDYHRVHGFGNLNESSIIEIWNTETYKRIREELRQGTTTLPICKNCIVRQKVDAKP